MAVEGEWAWPRCIKCGKKIPKKKPRDARYGMDVCCADCLANVSRSQIHGAIGWKIRNAMWTQKHFDEREKHGDSVSEREWQDHAKRFAIAWAHLRDHFQMPEFPAGLELFLVEIHNDRTTRY